MTTAVAAHRVGFRHVVRSEWIKLRTTRTTIVLVLVAAGLQALIVGLTSVFASADRRSTEYLLDAVTGSAIPVGLLLGVVGALAITAEHAHGTIRPTFAATPRRTRVYAAKFVVVTLAVGGAAAVIVVASTVVGALVFSSRGATISIGSYPDGWAALVGTVVWAALVAWIGLGLGLLTRSSPLTIVLLVLWPILIENLVGGLMWLAGAGGLVRWLPFTAGFALVISGETDEMLSRWVGGAWFAAIAFALVLIGTAVNRSRDA